MNRTTRVGFLIVLWSMALVFIDGDKGISYAIAGFLWFAFGGYLFLKEDK